MGDKRFPATRQKRERARKAGHIIRSRILESVGSLAFNFSILVSSWPLMKRLVSGLQEGLSGAGDLIEQNGGDFHTNNMLVSAQEAVWVYGCVAGVPLISIALVSLVQHRCFRALSGGGMPWSCAQILPKVARLNPLSGLRRIFGPQGAGGDHESDSTNESGRWPTRMLSELLRSTVLHCSVVTVLWQRSGQRIGEIVEIESLGAALCDELLWIFGAVVGCWAVLSIGDLVLERALHAKRLRMDLSELRRELRQSEGSPELRALRRQLHQTLLLHELVQGVRKARILVVNGDRRR